MFKLSIGDGKSSMKKQPSPEIEDIPEEKREPKFARLDLFPHLIPLRHLDNDEIQLDGERPDSAVEINRLTDLLDAAEADTSDVRLNEIELFKLMVWIRVVRRRRDFLRARREYRQVWTDFLEVFQRRLSGSDPHVWRMIEAIGALEDGFLLQAVAASPGRRVLLGQQFADVAVALIDGMTVGPDDDGWADAEPKARVSHQNASQS